MWRRCVTVTNTCTSEEHWQKFSVSRGTYEGVMSHSDISHFDKACRLLVRRGMRHVTCEEHLRLWRTLLDARGELWHVSMRHGTYEWVCVTQHIHMCDTTHLCVWGGTLWRDGKEVSDVSHSIICVTQLIYVCEGGQICHTHGIGYVWMKEYIICMNESRHTVVLSINVYDLEREMGITLTSEMMMTCHSDVRWEMGISDVIDMTSHDVTWRQRYV